jgi:hypothetical protein
LLITTAAKFGIVERMGSRIRITNYAVNIFSPESQTARKAALWGAIRGTDLFSLLLKEERGGGPEALHRKLVELGFTPPAAERALAAYREGVQFARNPPRGSLNERHGDWKQRPKSPSAGGSRDMTAMVIVPAGVSLVDTGVIVGAHLTAEADLDALIDALEATRSRLRATNQSSSY